MNQESQKRLSWTDLLPNKDGTYSIKKKDGKPVKAKGKKKQYNVDNYRTFFAMLDKEGIPHPIQEHKFHDKRKWRFDFAWIDNKLAMEIEGGIHIRGGGRHNRGTGYEKDMEKYNAANALGWRLLRFSPQSMYLKESIELIKRMISGQDL